MRCSSSSLYQVGGWHGLSKPSVFDFPTDLKLPYESREVLLRKVHGVGVLDSITETEIFENSERLGAQVLIYSPNI